MSDQPLHCYEVGTPYVAGHTSWPEQIEYNWREGAHELRMFFPGLRPDEIEAVRRGSMELRLVVSQPIIFLCLQGSTEGVDKCEHLRLGIYVRPSTTHAPLSTAQAGCYPARGASVAGGL